MAFPNGKRQSFGTIALVSTPTTQTKGGQSETENNGLHLRGGIAKYEVAAKFGQKAVYAECNAEMGKRLRELCAWKEAEILKAHACTKTV